MAHRPTRVLVLLATVMAGACANFDQTLQPNRGATPAVHAEQWTRDAVVAREFADRDLDSIEGIWSGDDGEYEIAVIRNNDGIPREFSQYQFVGVVTDSRNSPFRPGNIKLLLKDTASPGVYTGVFFVDNGNGLGTTLLLTSRNLVEFSVASGPYGLKQKNLLVRMYPKDDGYGSGAHSSPSVKGRGSGFFVGRGLIATNAHVIDGATSISVGSGSAARQAEVLVRDQANDLAILRVASQEQPAGQRCLPLLDPDTTKAGDRVFVLGYPLGGLLASSLSVSEGLVTSIRGIRDDPRMLQISVPIQPGHSGSPLLDDRARVVGVVTSTLNPRVTLAAQDVLPQNANFAVRAAYLKSLLSMVPGVGCSAAAAATPQSPAALQAAYGAYVVSIETR